MTKLTRPQTNPATAMPPRLAPGRGELASGESGRAGIATERPSYPTRAADTRACLVNEQRHLLFTNAHSESCRDEITEPSWVLDAVGSGSLVGLATAPPA